VHGSAVVNSVVEEVIDRVGDGHWVNATTMLELSEIGSVNARKMLATLVRVGDFAWRAFWWAPAYTAYMSIAITGPLGAGPAQYRDLLIWTIGAITSRRPVIHVHAADLSSLRPTGLLGPLQRWLIRRSEFWVLGPGLVAPLRAFGARNIHVVENGVTCESRHHGEGREEPSPVSGSGEVSEGADEADVRVVFLSHHFPFKGVDLAAELAEELAGEPFAWTFAGSAVDPAVEAGVAKLRHLGGRYRRLESVDADVRCRLLHRSDIFLFPSRNEGSPLVLLEAMEHGVVPVVSRRGCMPEVVGDSGTVCDTQDEYADALRLLAKDRSELRHRSEEASARWRSCYSREAFEQRIETMLLRVPGTGGQKDGARA
jgi:glycosyltransferase involved in cell wall biosynthesis